MIEVIFVFLTNRSIFYANSRGSRRVRALRIIYFSRIKLITTFSINCLNLIIKRVIYLITFLSSLIILFLVNKSSKVYYFSAISRKLIHRFSRIKITFLITQNFSIRFTNKWISRKYIFFSIYFIITLILTDLLS